MIVTGNSHRSITDLFVYVVVLVLCVFGVIITFSTSASVDDFIHPGWVMAGLIGTSLTVAFFLFRRLLQMIYAYRKNVIFKSLFTHHPASIALVDDTARTLQTNERFAVGYHLPKSNSVVGAMGLLVADPVGIVHKLHQDCDFNGSAVEFFEHGNLNLRVTVQRITMGGYLWQIEDAPEPGAAPSQRLELAYTELRTGGEIGYSNTAFKDYFGVTSDLQWIKAHVLDLGRTGYYRVPIDGNETLFFVKFVEQSAGLQSVYFFPEEGQIPQKIDMCEDGFDAMPVALIKIDPTGHIRKINPVAQSMLGALSPMAGEIRNYFSTVDEEWQDWIASALDGKAGLEPRVLKADIGGVEKTFRARLVPFDTVYGNFLLCALNDVSEIKALEEQFTQSQKMQSIGQLAGGVAHDFNNLLTAISGHCDLLLMDKDPHSPGYADLMQIHQNTNRAAALVAQLLSFSRKQSSDVQSLNLEEALSDLTHLLNRLVGEKVEMVLDPIPQLQPVRGNKRQIEQVLMNLVVNARDAMPEGGCITLSTRMSAVQTPIVAVGKDVPPGEYVVISVRDEGVGISQKTLDRIFEPFYTTKKSGEGTGLGLSTVMGIVDQCGGAIRVQSDVGKGTVFDVFLQTSQKQSVEKTEAPKNTPTQLTPNTAEHVVLLVEDEAPVRAFAARALQMHGHKVVQADSAEAALSLLEDGKLHVDVFVTDVIMPGMDGPTWVAKARQDRPDVKVVFVSGYAEDSFKGHEEEFEKAAFLPKPFSLAELTTTVQSLVA